ncbi:MAG: pyridoxamine 5'-phosphate oxidase family protein [Lachnospiraceae bacterium]|nr:pyridoxamine 5'-phosphate oxidase family protein [Lachnospiraceae bacterium]
MEFRKMRRFKQQVSDEECKRILKEEGRGVLAVIGDFGYPYAIPVDFYYDEDDNCIYMHGAKTGHKMDAISRCDKVCFTVWNQGYKEEGHWEWNSTSVVIFGKAKPVDDPEIIRDRLRKLAVKYYPSVEEADQEMETPAVNHVQILAIEIEHMTGKLVNEK